MFRPMRRKSKESSVDTVIQLLQGERYGILSVHGEEGYPYAIPVNFLYSDGKIYFHGSAEGHKAEAIKANDKICFTLCGKERILAEEWAPFVHSAVIFGRCRKIEDRKQALELCARFALKYYPSEKAVEEEISSSGNAMQMYEITIEHMTGKEIQEK